MGFSPRVADPKRKAQGQAPTGQAAPRPAPGAIRDFLQQGKPGQTLTPDGNGGLVWAGPMEQATAGDPLAWSETLRELKKRGVPMPPEPMGQSWAQSDFDPAPQCRPWRNRRRSGAFSTATSVNARHKRKARPLAQQATGANR